MQARQIRKPLDQVLAAIAHLDLEPIKFRLTHEKASHGWTPARADAAERGYRRYLQLLAKYPDVTIAPTADIDEFWHAHILDTRKYAADCEAVFGEFIHHYPYLGLLGEDDMAAQQAAAQALDDLYQKEFGEPVSALHAFCARAAGAFCAREPNAAAFCARQPAEETSFCARQPSREAAFCARRPAQDAAFCAREPQQAAFCARQPEERTAPVPARPAFCA
ncbi:MAG TPA: glycine-rich domain-containing protein-like [Burkholderiaceae bacterium]|nr:glycine-rich domain-containing protein-like [Burkholderiaceae bacterium]